jgi:hypothetical protein
LTNFVSRPFPISRAEKGNHRFVSIFVPLVSRFHAYTQETRNVANFAILVSGREEAKDEMESLAEEAPLRLRSRDEYPAHL